MSFIACLEAAVEDKKLKPAQAKLATARFNNFLAEYVQKGMSPPDAAAKAAEDATVFFEIENREIKRRTLNQLRANVKAWRDMQSYKGKKHKAWNGLFDTDDKAPYESYTAVRDGVERWLHSYMSGILEKFRARGAGAIRPKAGQEAMLREIFGENTGDAEARSLADAWKQTHKAAVDYFRMAGGSMLEREDWHLPQKQDYAKLRGKQRQWVDAHLTWMDWERVRRSDGSRIAPADRTKFLNEAYETLLSDGANRTELGGAGRRSQGNKLPLHRTLIYKDASSWLAMHNEYGSGSIFDVMLGHVSDMAHEIALVKRFGPNPGLTVENMKKMIDKLAHQEGDVGLAQDQVRAMDDTFRIISRETGLARPNTFGHIMAGTRNLLTSALLGSASLVAIPSDLNAALMAKQFNKLDGMRFLRRYLAMMNPLNQEDRDIARRAGFISENAIAQAYGLRRLMGFDVSGPSVTRRIADVVMNSTLLTPHTSMARGAFGMEMLGLLADNRGKAFDKLPFRDMLTRHGITAEDWEKLRNTPLWQPKAGVRFLRPLDYLQVDGSRAGLDVASKFEAMISTEAKMAVLDVNLQSRRILLQDTSPGTFAGELTRSAAMFKNFPITFANLLMRRYMFGEKALSSRMAFGTYLIMSMTVVGALRLQLGSISQGHDARPMDDPRFWMAAAATGGGFGIAGDFMFADYNRFGGGPFESFLGPTAQLADDAGKLTVGNIEEFLDGEDTGFLGEATKFAERYHPGTSIWWARVALHRMLWENLLEITDPKAQERFKRARRRRERDLGQTSWWGEGDTLPQRAPDLTTALP